MAASSAGDPDKTVLFQAIVDKLKSGPHTEVVKTHLKTVLFEDVITHEEQKEQAERWLKWARGRQHLKVVTANIPPDILPSGLEGSLYDVKVFSRRGPDDPIYDENEDIREKVARGNSFLHIKDVKGGSHEGTTCIVHAMKKFTGGLGDEDDYDTTSGVWRRYFSKPIDQTELIVASRKENGEAAHLSCRKLNDIYIICAGSKNVHLVLRTRADIEKYIDPRFAFAKEIAYAILDELEEMPKEDQQRLLDFLCATQFTATLEILNPAHQHIEDFSHLLKPKLKFITLTSNKLDGQESKQLSGLPPHVAMEIGSALGLTSVDYDVVPFSQFEDRNKKIRESYGYEGEVLFFLDKDQSVIGMLKRKTIWYVLCRAIREKVRASVQMRNRSKAAVFDVTKSHEKLERRIREIQTWLALDDDSVKAWQELGNGCITWCLNGLDNGVLVPSDLSDKYPVTWNRYLKDSGKTDKVMAKWKEPGGSDDF